jgi:transcriptional regulator with GAF, ATPase, and Fis domain
MQNEGREQFADAARSMGAAATFHLTLDNAVAAAVELIPGCEFAGASIVQNKRKITTEASTDDLVRRGDELQYELGEGPSLQSIHEQETVHSSDLTRESRWPTWSKRAADELGVRSMLCLQLFTGPVSLGSLNLYSRSVDAFDEADRYSAFALAAHVAVAMASAVEEENLELAVANRTIIGQAEGILIERFTMTPEQAFAVLVRLSQQRNTKLHHIAADLVRTGVLPEEPTGKWDASNGSASSSRQHAGSPDLRPRN